jgi:hypothetical protein
MSRTSSRDIIASINTHRLALGLAFLSDLHDYYLPNTPMHYIPDRLLFNRNEQ